MGRITKRQRHARNRARSETGYTFALHAIEEQQIAVESSESSEQNQPVEVRDITDYELLGTFEGVSDSQIDTVAPSFPFKWSSEVSSSRRYWGTARTTKLYRQKKSEEMGRGSKKITSFFKKVDDSDVYATNDDENETDADIDEKDEERVMSIEEALSKLSEITAPLMNQKTAAERQLSDYELAKYRGVMVYFMGLLNGKKKMIASQEAAKI
ncbi:hypothetical protein DFQ29_002694, partial [Apophysomyces sp. BC1021]